MVSSLIHSTDNQKLDGNGDGVGGDNFSWIFGLAGDTTVPTIASVAESPDPFSPDGDGSDDSTTITATNLADDIGLARWRVQIKSGGTVLRNLVKLISANGNDTIVWDGKDANGKMQASGVYLITLRTESHEETAKTMLYSPRHREQFSSASVAMNLPEVSGRVSSM